jgi:toxin ParE1/3/4
VKRRKLRFTRRARQDLTQLLDWIAERAGADIALAYTERVEAFCEGLTVSSERGHRRDDLRPGLRVVGFERRIAVTFVVTDDEVWILRLFYGGRDWTG